MKWFTLVLCLWFSSPATAQALKDDVAASHTTPSQASHPYQLRMTRDERTRLQLSALWTGVTLNMIAADVLSHYVPESRQEFTRFANGKESELMLAGAIYYQLPISMVVLSQVLPFQANRWTNRVTAALVATGIVVGGSTDPHYIVFASAELLGLTVISVKAWKWSKDDRDIGLGRGKLRLDLHPTKKSYGLRYSARF